MMSEVEETRREKGDRWGVSKSLIGILQIGCLD
jgi:hypothetical protein